ncbi:MAG: BatA domain-containing protein [Planctomycetota bacterium]
MLALAFLNPLLLWAVPLCAVPIIIHILNRRRFKQVPWAAMEYLLAAMKRNRKRLRMEQWLVLLLRTLAVLFLVFLVSRPQLGGGGLLSSRTHHVVVLDDSASMAQRSGSTSLFVKAQERLRALAADLTARRSGDLFSLVRTSRPGQPDLWAQRVGPELGNRVGALLKEFTVGDGSPDLGSALQATIKRAGEVAEAGRNQFWLAGDARAFDWTTEDDKPRPAVLAALQALRPGLDHLTVLGKAGPPANLAVVDVRLVDRLAVAGVPATLAVDVQNLGLDPSPPTTVAVEVDGQSRVVLTVPQLAPGERIAVPVGHTFHQAGHHRIEGALEPTETFPLDDRRTLALPVREKSRVLLVDGQPDEEEAETFFLQTAMEIEEGGIAPQVVSDQMLEETDLAPFDVVWLCNVQAPSAATSKRIEEFVAAGGGLVITCGAVVDSARWNELLWRDGQGVLPLPLGEIGGDPDRPEKAVLVQKDHPVCEGVAEVVDLLMGNVVLVKRWLQIVEDGKHGASVVARIRDAEGAPLLVTRTAGSGGEVALFSVTADKAWWNVPSTDLFVLLAMQLHRASARRQDLAGNNLLPDGSFRLNLDPGTFRPDVTLRALTGDDERTFTAREVPPPAPASLVVPMSELRRLGAYELELGRHDGAPEKRLLARNVPTVEGRLVPFADNAFARLYPADLHDRVTFVREETSFGDEAGEGEVWPFLAALLLVGLLLESLLAWRFGRR